MTSGEYGKMVVAPIVGGEGSDHRDTIGPLGQLGQGAPKPNPGKLGLYLAGTTSVVAGNVNLWVEGFNLRRPSLKK